MINKNTSWQGAAKWYDNMIEGEGTYQKDLILPNLLRLMELSPSDFVLDLACGQGFFAREFAKAGARVVGADSSPKMVQLAIEHSPKEIVFHSARANSLKFLQNGSVNKVAIVLALQNIENVADVLAECARVLKKNGTVYIVLNHPAFRVPQASDWGWDEAKQVQYRRVDKYLSETKVEIKMHPGAKPSASTVSFHRPLQFYFKALRKSGFSATNLEEWNSHKKSEQGPRAKAEDVARKEIPLFLCLVANKKEAGY